jgi:hypothetical protein
MRCWLDAIANLWTCDFEMLMTKGLIDWIDVRHSWTVEIIIDMLMRCWLIDLADLWTHNFEMLQREQLNCDVMTKCQTVEKL